MLRRGGLVAFPTETVYGLGADATNADAVRRLFAVKGRPVDHPVIVHLADAAQLDEWAASVPTRRALLADAFWPGPLTVIVPRRRAGSRRGHRRARHRGPARSRSAARARAAREVRRRDRGAVGEPVRPREPHHRRRRPRRSRRRRRRRARRRSVSPRGREHDRRLHGAEPVDRAPRWRHGRRARRGARRAIDRRRPRRVAAPGHARRATTPRRPTCTSSPTTTSLRWPVSLLATGARVARALDASARRLAAGRDGPRPAARRRRLCACAVRAAARSRRPRRRLTCYVVPPPPRASALGAAIADRLAASVMTASERPIGVFDSGLGGLTVLRSLIDLLPGEPMCLLRRHRPIPLRAEAPRRGPEVRARDRRPPRRPRRQAARGRLQQRDVGRARGAARAARHPGGRGDRARHARRGARDPVGPGRGDRHRGHDRVGRVPARRRRRSTGRSPSSAPRARASSSSWSPATSRVTRFTFSLSVCWRRFGTPKSTRWCSAVRITPCWPVRSAT